MIKTFSAALLAATVTTGVIATATPAQAGTKQVSRFKVKSWSGGAYNDTRTGAFSHCAASVKYKSGILLLFSVDREMKWRMGFAKTGWQLNRGDSYPISYRIDRNRIYRGTAKAMNKSLATVSLPGKQAPVFNQMRRGMMLSVATKTEVLQFRLNGSSRMLTSLVACASKRTAKRRSTNPFGGGTARSGRPSDQASPFGNAPAARNPFGEGTKASRAPQFEL